MRRLRHDLNYLTSAGLLVVLIGSALTGIIAQMWDLNDFVYHTYTSYVMVGFAALHVALNWNRMIAYARHRLIRRQPHPARTARQHRVPDHPAAPPTVPLRALGQTLLSRRGFVALIVGGVGGFFMGRGQRQPPPLEQGSDLGVIYHQWSKPGIIDAFGTVANWGRQPPLYKTYNALPQIQLPQPRFEGGLSVEEAIQRRRSTREFADQPLTLDELSRVLYLMGGITGERWGNRVRSAPSSGALYPIEVYPVVHNVSGLQPGVYHYGVERHTLAHLRAANLRSEVVQQGLSQQFLGQADVVLFFTVIFQRMRWKYQDRTYRYGLIEAGHLGQNVYLAATSLGLGACAVGAFMDDAINTMLGVDGTEEAAIYMVALGKIRS